MKLPQDAPVPIIDPFVQIYVNTEHLDVPMPREALRDAESLAAWPSSEITKHLFRYDDVRKQRDKTAADLSLWLENLDTWGISRAGVALTPDTPREFFDRLTEHADRIFVTLRANPHHGMHAVRYIQQLAAAYPFVRSVSMTPFQIYPFIAPNSKEYYPIYAKCVELDLAVFMNVGFPGPRTPAWVQEPIHLDEVCWFFPELRVVMRHGGSPWVEQCVRMLERWPNLYYATTAYAPRYYPDEILQFANTRGADKVIWAGYWPNLGYDRVFSELGDLDLREHVWPKFLAENARRAFKLDVG
jgi:predicted TIM-barrel fold metal-dependent hydrolase